MTLPVKLTDRELDERRDKLAALVREHTEAEQTKKDEAAQWKQKVDAIEKNMSDLAREIRDRAQLRPVEVKRDKHIELGIEELVRVDTFEVVETRSLGPGERQAELKLFRHAENDEPEAKER